jgi:hypothetical protein
MAWICMASMRASRPTLCWSRLTGARSWLLVRLLASSSSSSASRRGRHLASSSVLSWSVMPLA